jgi:hypothetical protein
MVVLTQGLTLGPMPASTQESMLGRMLESTLGPTQESMQERMVESTPDHCPS